MRNLFFAIIIAGIIIFTGCSSPSGNDPGTEYMPDMFHSIAYEANIDDYYYQNTWGSEEDYYKLATPRKPVHGTIPRGSYSSGKSSHFDGTATNNSMVIPASGSVPYYYEDTEEERARAMAEISKNPYPITDDGLAVGKNLYDINCSICHGAKGDGAGYLYDSDLNPEAKYPAAPANFLNDEFQAASNGRYYHGIMYGKNVMGGYADKLSYEERWQVIHYIRSLQAKSKSVAYNENANELNNIDQTYKAYQSSAQFISQGVSHSDGGGHTHQGGTMHQGGGMSSHTTTGGLHHEGSVHTNEGTHINVGAGGVVEEGKKKRNLKEIIKDTGEKVKDGTEKAVDKVKDGTGKAVNKVKGKVEELKQKRQEKKANKKGGDNDHDL